MKTILITLALALPAVAGSVVLGWDAQPGVSFKVWRGTELLQTVLTNQVTLELPDKDLATIRVTAFVLGHYGESAPAEITLKPFTFQFSEDLCVWTHPITVHREYKPSYFIRWTP